MRRRITAVAVGAAAALALTACSGGSTGGGSTAGGSTEGGSLRIGAVVDVTTWDPGEGAWGNEALYFQSVYDTLLRMSADGEIEPGLAETWEYDDSRTTLTLDLRDGVTFSDGEELTAEAAAESVLAYRDGAAPNAGYLSDVESVEAADENTVEIRLSQPNPALEAYLTQNAGVVGSPSAADPATTPVGSGPYVLDLDASIPGSRYELTAREDYWDESVQHYDAITINFYADATATQNALRDNQVDYSNLNSVSQLPDAEAAGYTAHHAPVNWKGFILSDREGTVNEALGEVKVRQAFNYALDREALLEAIESGHGEPTTQIFGIETAAYDESLEDRYPYDPEKAKELLAEAGYPDGVEIVQPQTSFTPASDYELVSDMLAESNIEMVADQVGSTFIGDLLGGKWGAFQFGLNQEPLAWQTYQLAVAPDAAWNVQHVVDPTVEELAERMRHGGDDADAAAQELNEHLVEQAWFAPIYRVDGVIVTGEGTTATQKVGEAVPNLWDILPE
ncbi:ABC transporter substrate-binding protein [Microbacterium sp. G2-8]|uniref:ABC transporter substrate-binding protein n=1 Tax=Microbacterium sp. G2-8 TaxID=2842454 RepID=UPI001C894A85|nr:ABC transporter substrate-binding protein [Microbacterium sp. G2-8]